MSHHCGKRLDQPVPNFGHISTLAQTYFYFRFFFRFLNFWPVLNVFLLLSATFLKIGDHKDNTFFNKGFFMDNFELFCWIVCHFAPVIGESGLPTVLYCITWPKMSLLYIHLSNFFSKWESCSNSRDSASINKTNQCIPHSVTRFR